VIEFNQREAVLLCVPLPGFGYSHHLSGTAAVLLLWYKAKQVYITFDNGVIW